MRLIEHQGDRVIIEASKDEWAKIVGKSSHPSTYSNYDIREPHDGEEFVFGTDLRQHELSRSC